jgi:serine phosphatase RsbU (regulator of sigma subunit)
MLRLRAGDLAALAESGEPHLARQAQTALALGASDLVILGLVARDAVLGVLTVARRDQFTDDEVAELADVATHVGTALDAGRLLALQREVATALQTSLLPPMPAVAGLALAARYVPAARGLDVGGDWYDAFPTSSGLAVVVGDVRGHDLAAAARMADLRNLLRAHVVDRDEPPAALLARLERTAEALGVESSATCVVGRLVRGDGGWRLLWANAGHLPPVLLHEGRAVLLEPEPDLMLGVESGTARADHEQPLAAGDVLVLCTDGLVERRDSTLDARLEQLRALVEEHGDAPPDLVAERLLDELAAGSTDDVALLVVQVAAG